MSLRKAYLTIQGEGRAVAFAALLVQRDIPFDFQSAGKARNDDRLFRFEVESAFSASVFPSPLGDLDQIDDSAPTEEALAALRDQAQAQYCYRSDNDIEVDDEPRFSHGEGGTWVSGWLWIADEEDEEEEDDTDDEYEAPTCAVCDEPITADQVSVEKDGGEIHLECEPLYDTDAEDDEPEDEAECGKCVTCGAQCVSGGEGSVICPVCDQAEEDQRVAALKLVGTVARMTPDPAADDAVDTVNSLIAKAKEVLA